MGNKIVLLHILIGFLSLVAGDDVQSSTSTSVSVSTVTRKVSSRSFSRAYQGQTNVTQGMATVTEDMLVLQDANTQASENEDANSKPQKVKKKILASNLKNVSDKPTPEKSAVNVTESFEGGKLNSSDSAEDELVEEVAGKSENGTAESKAPRGRGKDSGGPIEGRSLEDRSSEENVNVNTRIKMKNTPSTTERTTNGYSYATYGELQKVLNNNYLSVEGYEQRAARPSPSVILPNRKSTPISRDNSLKNTIRFESEYYGPTGQTDWVPIIPDKLPVRSPSAAQNFGIKLKPAVVEKSNKTSEKNAIVFPSDAVQPVKDKNAIPVRGQEVEKTTIHQRNTEEKQKVPTLLDSGTQPSTQPVKHVTKFRGAVRYKPQNSNSTTDGNKFQNETTLKRNNISVEIPAVEIPVTGATWIPTTLAGGKAPGKPIREETTEISVISSTNHTTKSQNAVDGGLAVPPGNMKVDNITKDQSLKNPGVVSHPEDSSSKWNESTIANTLPKVVEGSKGWLPMKSGNDSDVVIPDSIDVHQRQELTPLIDEMKSSTEFESTSVDVTTEEATTTESTPELTTFLKFLNATTETPAVSYASSQGSVEKVKELPVTIALMGGDKSSATEEAVDASVTLTPDVVMTTTLGPDSENEDVEKFTEVQQTTEQGITTSEEPLVIVSMATQREGLTVSNQTTTATSPVITVHNTTPSMTTTKFTTTPKPVAISTTKKTPEVIRTTTLKPSTANATNTKSPPTTPIPMSETTRATTAAATTTATPRTSTFTTTVEISETKSETTEEGIYYKNYIPTTVNPHDDITEENVPAYLRLTVQAKSWEELCRLKEDLRDAIIKMLGGKNVSSESVHFLNLNERNCQEKIEETRGDSANGTIFLPVNMFLMDKNGDFDKNLSEAFLTLWGRRGLDFELPIRKVDFVTPIVNLTELADSPLGGSVVAAIVISCVAGICVILLGILFVIMKRRQKRFNYGQRCTPVSLDAYSLDSVSIYNSVRRKGVRASKRSYGNAAFDDPEVPTHPMNFAGLANFSSDKEQLYDEFNIIPQVYPKVEELPAGAETKNRYANVIPLPETRVHLSVKDGDTLSDYINANYVRGLKGTEKLYIACQAPLESTVEDFWRMVWEQQCKVILMLTDLQENGIEKCADYLPPNEVTDNLRLFGDFQVTLKKRDVKEKYIISNLKLKNMEANLWREVTHLWYLGWPDQGVPSEANSLIAFLIEARSQMKIQNGATTSSPVVVHCSPGTGRTGTVIACDLCIREYEQSRMVDIPKCVFNLRRDRAGCVQTKDQYAFIYQVLNVYATKLSGGGIESI